MSFNEFLKNTREALKFAISRGDNVSDSRTIKFTNVMRPSKEAFESLGFEFSDTDDPNTLEAKLPDGWSVSNCIGWEVRHYHWIYDEKNRRRVWYLYGVSPFGGAYGYAELKCRYSVCDKTIDEKECEYYDEAKLKVMYIADRAFQHGNDCICEIGKYDEDEWGTDYEMLKKACKFLEENFPDWRNPLAYWD